MSYAKLQTSYWQALQPDGPWEAGAPGWAAAPFVGWGQNPDRSLPPMLATEGLGCGCSAKGVGADSLPVWPLFVGYGFLALVVWGAFKFAGHADRQR